MYECITKTYKMTKTLESTINYIRNVLRKEGITGMESINHRIAGITGRSN